ncbi:MAG TPA: site-specific integrase [Halothiobacillus sp.]|nr:site-specific integrase [Halothiobacillus sp.]
MAKPRKHGKGWRVQITTPQGRISKTFTTKEDAFDWERAVQREIDQSTWQGQSPAEWTTFRVIAERFRDEILPTKKSQTDQYPLKILIEAFGDWKLIAITPEAVASYRDARLKKVSSSTVRKDISLLQRVLKQADQEWGCRLPMGIPTERIRKPSESRPRTRRASMAEIDAIIAATRSKELPAFLMLQLETAMRRSESLKHTSWKDVDLNKRTMKLVETKNGEERTVPLSTRAVNVLQSMPRRLSGKLFGSTPDGMTRAFIRARERARQLYLEECHQRGETPDPDFLVNLRLHDIRHEATTRFFELGTLDMMAVSAITGHKDLKSLKRYTHLKAEDLALKLG